MVCFEIQPVAALGCGGLDQEVTNPPLPPALSRHPSSAPAE